MLRTRPGLLLLLALLLAPAGAPRAGADDGTLPVLADAVPQRVALALGEPAWTARMEVPGDALALCVVAAADLDLDLYLQHGRPAFGGEEDAVVAGLDEGTVEVLRVGREAPPVPGDWYLTVEHVRASMRGVTGQVVAFVDRKGGARTVLPGHAVSVMPSAGAATLRTWVPPGTTSLRLDLAATLPAGATPAGEARGPEGRVLPLDARKPFVLAGDALWPGLWTFTLRGLGEAAVGATLAWAAPSPADSSDAAPLGPGRPQVLRMGGSAPSEREWRVDVPAGWRGFTLTALNDADEDLDLYVRRGEPMESPEQDADWMAITSSGEERLVVGGLRELAPGPYFVRATLVGEGPVVCSVTLQPVPEGKGPGLPRTWGGDDPAVLAPGAWTPGRIDASQQGIRWHALTPPAGTRSLHAVLLDAELPLDLLLVREGDGSILSRAISERVDERLDQSFPAPLPAGRRFLLGVVCMTTGEQPADYRVAVSYDAPPALPPDLVWPPLAPREGLTPVERVAAATVELTCDEGGAGSATCISPRGLLLSCRHVLESPDDPSTVQRTGIYVAFSRALDRPPVQCFLARVVAEDAALDVALLEITADIFGRPLPGGLALPHVPLGRSDALRLGAPVTVFGYPQDGSEQMRTPVILSRGTVSGFEHDGEVRTWVKTDAWIGPGHSGGTLVNEALELVAVPAATLGGSERMGLAVPVDRLPAEWKARLARDLEARATAR